MRLFPENAYNLNTLATPSSALFSINKFIHFQNHMRSKYRLRLHNDGYTKMMALCRHHILISNVLGFASAILKDVRFRRSCANTTLNKVYPDS